MPIICDLKCGDIPVSNAAYADAVFSEWGFDAVTVNPFAGVESLWPFFEHEDRVTYVWAMPSNLTELTAWELSDYYSIPPAVSKMRNKYGNAGIIMGAQDHYGLAWVVSAFPSMPILIPGITQNDETIDSTLERWYNKDIRLRDNILINSSSGIMYSDDPREAIKTLVRKIKKYKGLTNPS